MIEDKTKLEPRVKNHIQLTQDQLEQIAEIYSTPDRRGLTLEKVADLFGCSVSSIQRAVQKPEVLKLIKEERARYIQTQLPAIDRALMDKARKGDVPAATLVYERWDDYVRRSKSEVSGYIEESEAKVQARKRVSEFLRDLKAVSVVSSVVGQGDKGGGVKEG